MNVLITGGCGFIGANLVRHVRAERPAWRVVNLDKLTYAGNLESLTGLAPGPEYRFVRGDVQNAELLEMLFREQATDCVMHLAAESHVDRSLEGPEAFVRTNALGTQVLLQAAHAAKVKRVLVVSTDEVYGSLGTTGRFTESSPLKPSSPYSASKASSDLLALAFHHSFKMDVVVTRCSNNYGPYQFPEKLIPLMIVNALRDLPLPVYGDGKNVRDWLHVQDHCEALVTVLEKGRAGEVYNIGGASELENLDIVKEILGVLKKPESLIRFVEDRPGHDRRYAIDFSKLQGELGWKPRKALESGLRETVEWYVKNTDWWNRVMSGAYREFYQRNYSDRLGLA
jgi:dTDP-glucose 4,6-dehydratase